MLVAKRSAGVAPEVNLRECVTYKPLPSVNKDAHSDFETQRRHHQKSKTGVTLVIPSRAPLLWAAPLIFLMDSTGVQPISPDRCPSLLTQCWTLEDTVKVTLRVNKHLEPFLNNTGSSPAGHACQRWIQDFPGRAPVQGTHPPTRYF